MHLHPALPGFALAKEQSPPVRANGQGALIGGLRPPGVQTLRAEHQYCKPYQRQRKLLMLLTVWSWT